MIARTKTLVINRPRPKTILKKYGIGLIFYCSVFSSAHTEVPDEIISAIESGKYNVAYDTLAGLAEAGDAEGAYYFALLHQRGLGVPFNPVKAIAWFRRSAEADFPPALYELGRMYRTGSGVPQNIFQSVKYLKAALTNGYSQAGMELASIYEEGDGVAVDLEKAAEYRVKATNIANTVKVKPKSDSLAIAEPNEADAQSAQTAVEPKANLAPTDVQVVTGRKLALVIGNDAYTNVARLQNSTGDAKAIAEALTSIGFDVQLEDDLDFADTAKRIADFRLKIRSGDTVFFHFSGHGVEVQGDNLLLPTDVPAPKEGQQALIKSFGTSAGELIDEMKKDGASLVVAVLDACRENPFAQKGTRGLGGDAGLARMDPPEGTFVMYSAGANQLALDRLGDSDTENTSVFTRTLVPLLQTPNTSLITIAKRTQSRVKELAETVDHQQTPAYYDQIVGEVALFGN